MRSSGSVTRRVGWIKDPEDFGIEWAEIRVGPGVFASRGVAIGTVPLPYRLDHELETDERYATKRLAVRVDGDGWRRRLDLRRAADGRWSSDASADGDGASELPAPGADAMVLDSLADGGAIDCDLGLSPVTNSMPVLRHNLLQGGDPVDFLMAWVSVPDLQVSASRQRYTPFGERDGLVFIRYSSGTFAADVSFDGDGLVVDYPQLARRLGRTRA